MELKLNLQLFTDYTNKTTSNDTGNNLTYEMKTFYDKVLLKNAKPNLVHDQFAQKRNIPKGAGKTIEFRKYSPLAKITSALGEGVTPDGQALDVTHIEATVAQYGGFIRLTDMLMLTAIDNNLVEATELLGDQAGRSLDTITREVLNGGSNVQYAGTVATTRNTLTQANGKLAVADIKKAVTTLKVGLAKKIDASYVGIIHPYVSFDLTNDSAWVNASEYAGSTQIFEGEIGKIHGVRFVETTEAKIWADASGDTSPKAVFSTLILGANAYGTTEVEGGGLQTIVKQLGSAGTADPLDQRATVGWKAIKTAVRLYEGYMVRIESCSTYDPDAN